MNKQAGTPGAWARVRAKLNHERERERHESEIATCPCGGSLRKGLDGTWVHGWKRGPGCPLDESEANP